MSRRLIGAYLAITYTATLAVALAFPHRGVAPLLTMLAPAMATFVSIRLVVPKLQRSAMRRALGWRRPRVASLAIAVLLPLAVAAASFGVARILGFITLPGLDLTWKHVGSVAATIAIGSILLLGEEIGWRGLLYPQLTNLMPRKRAALVTGMCHAAFHLPLLLLTTVYQSSGSRWIVVPTVLVTISAGGVIYGWLRETSGSLFPVTVLHSAFNTFMDLGKAASVAASAATIAYVTTETGAFTLLTVVGLAAWLLTRTWSTPTEPRIGPLGTTGLPATTETSVR